MQTRFQVERFKAYETLSILCLDCFDVLNVVILQNQPSLYPPCLRFQKRDLSRHHPFFRPARPEGTPKFARAVSNCPAAIWVAWSFGKVCQQEKPGGGFSHFLFLPSFGEMTQFDYTIVFKRVETTRLKLYPP